jgi:hypothetical protein
MNRRYFVTYKHWNGSVTETATDALGRFYDLDAAERRARERYNEPGYEILAVRPETDFEAAIYRVYRFFIRLVRIVCAVAIALFTYAWLSDSGPNLGDIPLGNFTLNMIFSALFHGVLFLGAVWLCWVIAFGEGPQDVR